jgi:nucleoside-diphosphate-sugar epimerase
MARMTSSEAKSTVPATCLVTGCAGFVGSHLCEALLDMGQGVVGVDDFFSGKPENMRTFQRHPAFHFHERDINDPELLRDLKREYPDLCRIFHLAAVVSVAFSMEHPEETMRTNFTSSIALYEEAMALSFRSFVFAGSAAEYGNLDILPLGEEDVSIEEATAGLENLHASPYGQSKYLVSRYFETCGFGSSLRFFNIYGPRQDAASQYSGVISRFMSLALSGESLTILGSGEQSRDFINVSDAVEAYLVAAGMRGRTTPPLCGIYNVGTQKGTSILELAGLIGRITGNMNGLCFLPPRPGDIKHSLANVEKLRRETGFKARVDLETGLRRLLDWERNRIADSVQPE